MIPIYVFHRYKTALHTFILSNVGTLLEVTRYFTFADIPNHSFTRKKNPPGNNMNRKKKYGNILPIM